MNIHALLLISAAGLLAGTASMSPAAENLVANPSAEQVAANGQPEGWGRYVGAGALQLASTRDEKHSGERAACLELTAWHTPQDAPDAAARRSVSGAIILAPNDGYNAQGAIACPPGTSCAFSFWYVPQLYTKSVDAFAQQGLKTKVRLGACDLVTGLAVSWSGIYPERQTTGAIKSEIGAARKLGAKGFVVFHLDLLYAEHFQALGEISPVPR